VQNMEHRDSRIFTVAYRMVSQLNHNGRRYDNRLLGSADGSGLDTDDRSDFPRWIGFRRTGEIYELTD